MDEISEHRLAEVCPPLAVKIRLVADALLQEGIVIRVTQGLRTCDEQAKLYAEGRTVPGARVTNAPPGFSWHNFGLAVDVVPSTHGPGRPFDPDWNEKHPCWTRIVRVGAAAGLVSGATFRSRPDEPHFQLTGCFPVTPTDEVRALLRTGGLVAVWKAAGLGGITNDAPTLSPRDLA